MSRETLLILLRWFIGLALLVAAWWLATQNQEEDPIDITRLILGAIAFLVGVSLLWTTIFYLATRPFVSFVDQVFSPGGKLERPVLNLKLPAHYLNEARYDEALAEYHKILKYYPDEPEAYEKAIWLESSIYERPREAAKLLRRAKRRRLRLDERFVLLAGGKRE